VCGDRIIGVHIAGRVETMVNRSRLLSVDPSPPATRPSKVTILTAFLLSMRLSRSHSGHNFVRSHVYLWIGVRIRLKKGAGSLELMHAAVPTTRAYVDV